MLSGFHHRDQPDSLCEISMSSPLNVIDLMQKAKELSGNYENVVLSEINDHVVRISMMTEPYFWHLHPNSDETFLGLEGTVILEFEDRRVELRPGQVFTVPRGMKHRTAPADARSVNLTIERADIVTVRVNERPI
jgi:mannose-6-phosphate isomerase-like protein (cupin superfamily)